MLANMGEKQEKKTPGTRNAKGQFVKGSTGNPTGRTQLPLELHRMRRAWNAEFIRIFDKYARKTPQELMELQRETDSLPYCEYLTVKVLIKAANDACHHKFTLIKETLGGKDKGELVIDHNFPESDMESNMAKVPKSKVLELARKLLLEPQDDARPD